MGGKAQSLINITDKVFLVELSFLEGLDNIYFTRRKETKMAGKKKEKVILDIVKSKKLCLLSTCSQPEPQWPPLPISSSQSCQAGPFFPYSIYFVWWIWGSQFNPILPQILSNENEVCLWYNLLVEWLFFLNFIVDNCKVVRAMHKVGQVQGVVPVLGGDKVDRKTKRWKKRSQNRRKDTETN